MAVLLSATVRSAMLDAIETAVGTGAILKIWQAATAPATIATADTGTTLVSMTLESDWMAAASGGTKAKAGTWADTSADATGSATYFRIYASDGTTQHFQGTVGQGSGDLSLDNTSIAQGQSVSISTFTLTGGNG